MAGWRVGRGHRNADAASGHRLARHVRYRIVPCDRRLFHPGQLHEPTYSSKRELRPPPPIKLLVKDAATTKISIGMVILCAVQNFGYYGVMIWLPNYLVRGSFGLRNPRPGPQ